MIVLSHEGSGEIFYATSLSAGFDISADEDMVLPPGGRAMVPTGLRIISTSGRKTMTLDDGAKVQVVPELQIRPRSGLAAKCGVTALNSPGTVDADYRGEIKVILINHGAADFVIHAGDRIAQGVCSLAFQPETIPVKQAERKEGGFGSTGV